MTTLSQENRETETHMGIFAPHIMSQRCGFQDEDEAARAWLERHPEMDPRQNPKLDPNFNPFSDPDNVEDMCNDYHRDHGLDWSYSGYLKDRSTLWRGMYQEKEELWLHPALDIPVPAGTEVFALLDGEILYTHFDPSVGGWGKHAIQKIVWNDQIYALIYAHLHKHMQCKKGDELKRGQSIGWIGDKTVNGGWAPHLHLQLWGVDVTAIEDWKQFLEEHDGYVKLSERRKWAKICPDPTPLIFAEHIYPHGILPPK